MEHVQSVQDGGRPEAVPLLSVIVPAYNSADYLDRSLESLIGFGDSLEVVVVDDGSTDTTPAMADDWAARHPGVVRVIHQANAGHGGALNTGIAQARGTHLKVLDSDDWLDRRALVALLNQLGADRAAGRKIDLVVSNYVYEKAGKAHKVVIRYHNVLPVGRVFGWESMRRCRQDQYLLMHSLVYRTELLRDSGLVLPEHTFYVDYLYSFVPLPLVRTIRYLDVDLYRYFIGREDQSVNEPVMISRIDQLLRVNHAMVSAMPPRDSVDPHLYRYMAHYLTMNSIVCSIMLVLSGTPEHIAAKDRLWRDLDAADPDAARAVRSTLMGRLVPLRGRSGRLLQIGLYRCVRGIFGFS